MSRSVDWLVMLLQPAFPHMLEKSFQSIPYGRYCCRMASPGATPGYATLALPAMQPSLEQGSKWVEDSDEEDLMSLLMNNEDTNELTADFRQQDIAPSAFFWEMPASSATRAAACEPSPVGQSVGLVTSQWLPQAEPSSIPMPSSCTVWSHAGGGSRTQAMPNLSIHGSAASEDPEVNTASLAALLRKPYRPPRGPLPQPRVKPVIPRLPGAQSPEHPGSPDYTSLLTPDLGKLSKKLSPSAQTNPIQSILTNMHPQRHTADPSSLLSTSQMPKTPPVPLSMAGGTWSIQKRSASGAGHARQETVMAASEASSSPGSPRILASLLMPDLAETATALAGKGEDSEEAEDIMSLLMPSERGGPVR